MDSLLTMRSESKNSLNRCRQPPHGVTGAVPEATFDALAAAARHRRDRRRFRAIAEPVRSVFDIAAGVDLAVVGQKRDAVGKRE